MRLQIELSNQAATELAGSGDAVLRALEGHVACDLFLRGNVITLDGEEEAVAAAATVFREAGRAELAAGEEAEARIIETYLPAELPDDDLRAIVAAAVAETGARSPKDMGQVMKAAMTVVDGRADGKRVSALVREALSH